jgi:alpha-glucosidase
MRPLFLHYEDDARLHAEIPVPVWPRSAGGAGSRRGRRDWTLYLPQDSWVNAWTGEICQGGDVTVDAPLGKPPVFYRRTANGQICLAPYVISDKARPRGDLRADGEQ